MPARLPSTASHGHASFFIIHAHSPQVVTFLLPSSLPPLGGLLCNVVLRRRCHTDLTAAAACQPAPMPTTMLCRQYSSSAPSPLPLSAFPWKVSHPWPAGASTGAVAGAGAGAGVGTGPHDLSPRNIAFMSSARLAASSARSPSQSNMPPLHFHCRFSSRSRSLSDTWGRNDHDGRGVGGWGGSGGLAWWVGGRVGPRSNLHLASVQHLHHEVWMRAFA